MRDKYRYLFPDSETHFSSTINNQRAIIITKLNRCFYYQTYTLCPDRYIIRTTPNCHEMSNQIGVIFFFLITIAFNQVYCLRCYTCSYVDPSPDKSCISSAETEGQRTTLCSKKYCTIQRQETLNPPGKIVSFIRDCQDKPLYLNDIQTDSTYKVYYRSCTSDLCNNGDGRQILSAADPDFGAGENLIVEGKNGSISIQQSILLILVTWVICLAQ